MAWRPLPSLPTDKYDIDLKGNVRNRETGHVLKPQVDGTGTRVCVWVGGKTRKLRVDEEVAQAFPGDDKEAAAASSTRAKRPSMPKKQRKPVEQLDANTERVLGLFPSASEARRRLGLSVRARISECCRGELQTAGGFRWRFASASAAVDTPPKSLGACCMCRCECACHAQSGLRAPGSDLPVRPQQDAKAASKAGEKAKTASKPVEQISPSTGAVVARFPSARAAANALGIAASAVGLCCRGGGKTAGKFRWRFAEPSRKRKRSDESDRASPYS